MMNNLKSVFILPDSSVKTNERREFPNYEWQEKNIDKRKTGQIISKSFKGKELASDITGGNTAGPCLPAPEADAGGTLGVILQFTTTSQSGPEHEKRCRQHDNCNRFSGPSQWYREGLQSPDFPDFYVCHTKNYAYRRKL
jgi:hypothetical protein